MSTNKYLLPSSFHPQHITTNIPYNVALRIRRICSDDQNFEKRLTELKVMPTERKYKPDIINRAYDKARKLNRNDVLKKKSKMV